MKDFKIYVIIASLILVGYFITQYNQPKPVVWTPTYSKDDKIPFGTYVLYNRITDIFSGDSVKVVREPVYNVLNDHHIESGTYLIICEDINLTKYDISKLKTFIKKGNDVFIAARNFGDTLKSALNIETDYNYADTTHTIHFVNKHINQNKKYLIIKEQRDNYFSQIDTASAISIAQDDSLKSTFISYRFGKGNLYLNSNPAMFTNYSMLNKNGAEYISRVFSYLKNNKTILWDEYYTAGRQGEQSVFRVFFKNPPLKWAYCIAIIGFILFVLYEKKRLQRIIPIIEPLKNSTLDFVNVVGQVYYEQRNNQNIAEKKILFLLEYLRTKYYLKTTELDKEFAGRLSQKTGVALAFAQEFVGQLNYIGSQKQVSDHDLIELNQLIEQFYIQSQ